MKQHTALILLAGTLTIGCGDSASENNDNSTSGVNSAANGTPNGAANGVVGPSGDGPGWYVVVDAPVDLPTASSDTMTTTVNGGILSLAGAATDTQAFLTGAIELDGELGVKEYDATVRTKSGLMLGLGEQRGELLEALADLRQYDVDFLTLGQYLQPGEKYLPVVRYVPPEEFDELADIARSMGFRKVASGPFVRSSYHARDMAE